MVHDKEGSIWTYEISFITFIDILGFKYLVESSINNSDIQNLINNAMNTVLRHRKINDE